MGSNAAFFMWSVVVVLASLNLPVEALTPMTWSSLISQLQSTGCTYCTYRNKNIAGSPTWSQIPSSVYKLDLANNLISDGNLNAIPSTLRILNLNSNKLKELRRDTSDGLTYLYARNNSIDAYDFTQTQSPLTFLDLSGNGITSFTCASSGMPQRLNLTANLISTVSISSTSGLERLWIESNRITSVTLSGAASLEFLSLANNFMESFDLMQSNLPKVLSLRDNRLSGTLSWDGGSAGIEHLDVSGNHFTSVSNFPDPDTLKIINISRNALTSFAFNDDYLPEKVDVSYNMLSSQVQVSSTTIKVLNASHNRISEFSSFPTGSVMTHFMLSDNLVYQLALQDGSGTKYPTRMNLSDNAIESQVTVPSSTTGLRYLYLMGNKITSIYQFYSPVLSLCNFSGNFLTSFDFGRGNLPYTLDLSENRITEVSNFRSPTSTYTLSLRGNLLRQLPQSFSSSYYTVDLSHNIMIGSVASINPFPQTLDLSYNRLSEAISISGSTGNLRYLYLSHNRLTEVNQLGTSHEVFIYADFSYNFIKTFNFNSPQLPDELHLTGNRLSDAITLQSGTGLLRLSLGQNYITSVAWSSLSPPLDFLNCSGNLVEMNDPGFPGGPNADMSHNFLSGEISVSSCATTCRLEELYASHNCLSGVRQLSTTLDVLDLSFNKIGAFSFSGSGQVPLPIALDLSHNQLSGNLALSDPDCKILNVAHNFITTVSALSDAYSVNLSGNQIQTFDFTKTIPVTLDLSGNLLSGTVSLSSTCPLQVLSLANNQIGTLTLGTSGCSQRVG